MKSVNLKKLLYKSFDQELTEKERALLDEGLNDSEELRLLRDNLLDIRQSVRNSSADGFSENFESKLLEKLDNIRESRSRSSKDEVLQIALNDPLTVAFRKIALSAAIVLGILLTYNLTSGNNALVTELLGISQTSVEYAFDPAVQIIWN